MRKAWHMRSGLVLLGLLLAAAAGYGQVILHTIDPNGDDSPSAVKDLELSFRLNTVDILAPFVLMTADGQLGFTNYIKSGTQANQGYVLVFRPEAEDAADRIVTAIPVGEKPALMFFNPDQTRIWVVNLGNFGIINNTTASISVIDVGTLTVATTIPMTQYQFGFGSNIIFTADGSTAFISSTYTDQVLKIDTATGQVTQTLLLISQNPYYYTSVGPAWLTLSHDETFLCSTNTFNDTVSIIDAANLTERHQVVFRESGQGVHNPNFTFRNNVLLNEEGTLGFIASIGTQMLFGVVDRVYEFDPVTGLKIKDEDGKDVYLATADDPSQIMLDPSGEFLIVQVTSYDQVDTTDTALYGFPEIDIYKWPTLELYKVQQFKNPGFNMSRTSQFDFVPNGDGTYDVLFPSFSTYPATTTTDSENLIVRVPIALHKNTSSLGFLGGVDVREMPVVVRAVPGASHYVVANFLTGTLHVCSIPPVPKFTSIISMFIEDDHFSSLALLNRLSEDVTFQMQSYQTNNTADSDDDSNSGSPFYYVENSQLYIIGPYDIPLESGQQLVTMFQGLIPDYSKVVGQHGFTKMVHADLPVEGIGFNGALDDDGVLVRGDYLKINYPMFQDGIIPFLYSLGDNIHLVVHYVNPYYNQYHVQRYAFDTAGIQSTTLTSSFTVPNPGGIDQVYTDTIIDGYVRIFNLDNVNTEVYATVENKNAENQFLFACPSLDPYPPTSTHSYFIPYFAVGESYDTSVVLISTNQATTPDPEDPDGDPIPLKTHVRFDFYDIQGQWVDAKEFDFNNTARFEKYFSDETMLNLDRFGSGIAIGSVVVTLDRDNVCGVYTYSQWNTFDPDEDTIHPFRHIRNMTVDPLPLDTDATDSLIFPFTINIPPFFTSYGLYNPGEEPATVRVELYQGDGTLVAESPADISIDPHATFLFFLGDQAVFGDLVVLDNFVGYMKVVSTNGRPFIGKSIQSSPDMLAMIPTL